MKGDLLSQAEVESLLAAGLAAAGGDGTSAERVTRYDFRRGERVGAETLRILERLHEGFSRSFAEALSTLVRSTVSVKLSSVDQLGYGEFIFSLESPTCCNVLRADALASQLVLDINPSILYPIIDRLLGGGRKGGVPARRALTEIELRLVSRITTIALQELKRAWKDVLALEPVVERVESNPQAVQIASADDSMLVVSFEITVGDERGMMNFALPLLALGQFTGDTSSVGESDTGLPPTSPQHAEPISRDLRATSVEIVATLAETHITPQQLLSLRVGDIISTDKPVQTPIPLNVEGVTKFSARPGAFKGHKAVSIQQVIEPPRDP